MHCRRRSTFFLLLFDKLHTWLEAITCTGFKLCSKVLWLSHHDLIVKIDLGFLTLLALGTWGTAVIKDWTSHFLVESSCDILFVLIWCFLVSWCVCFFPLTLFVKAANFLSVLAPFSLLHCFSISSSALYEQIVGCESSIFSLWHTERSIAFLILLCLLCICPNYRQVTAETSLSKETGWFSGIDSYKHEAFISLTSFQ